MQNKPNFQNVKNVLTLVNIRNYNKLWDVDYYAKQTQSNPISLINCREPCFEHLSATGGFRFEKLEFVSDFGIRISSLTLYMKGSYDKNVASTLVSSDVLWTYFGVSLECFGVPLECFWMRLDVFGWPWSSTYKQQMHPQEKWWGFDPTLPALCLI